METRRYALDNWIYPFLGDLCLRDVNNRTMKELVEELAAGSLAPATIQNYVKFAKSVVVSAVDEDGEEKFPRKWNGAFIDAPTVSDQRQPTRDCEGMSNIVLFAVGRYQMLPWLAADRSASARRWALRLKSISLRTFGRRRLCSRRPNEAKSSLI